MPTSQTTSQYPQSSDRGPVSTAFLNLPQSTSIYLDDISGSIEGALAHPNSMSPMFWRVYSAYVFSSFLSAKEALKPCLAGVAHISNFALPSGMYASQIWAIPCLNWEMTWKTALKNDFRFLKSILGVGSSTPLWSVLRKCGAEPIQMQFNWSRFAARLYKYLIHCNSPLLHKVFHHGSMMLILNSAPGILILELTSTVCHVWLASSSWLPTENMSD
eukprot:1146683-Pelagomonas_calceolata.AAC.3